MISKESRSRVDFFAVYYFVFIEILRELKLDRFETEAIKEEAEFEEIFGKDDLLIFSSLPTVISNPCANSKCNACPWHAQAAHDALAAWESSTEQNVLDDLTEDDEVDAAKLRTLMPYIFDAIGKHYNYAEIDGDHGSTIRDHCCRKFGVAPDQLYDMFIKGLSPKPNPITVELENKPTRDETTADLRSYISSIGECIQNWLL